MEKNNLFSLKYDLQEIEKKTKRIYGQILKESKNIDKGNFSRIGSDDLQRLFELYDLYFFDRFFYNGYKEKVFFRLSQRMTRSGGKTVHIKHDDTYEIVLSTTLIFQTFRDVEREVLVNGIVCHDRLEAVMRIFEHEIIHLLEFVLFGYSSCSQPNFKYLSRNIFGHSGVTHQLVTQTERAWKKFDLRPGDEVFFDYQDRTYQGFIYRITRRATVMVSDPNGCFADSQGNHYAKYYIPIQFLSKTKTAPTDKPVEHH